MKRIILTSLAILLGALIFGAYQSVYTPDYLFRVLVKQDSSADDYLWKASYEILAAGQKHSLMISPATESVTAAFESHDKVDDLENYLQRTGTKALIVLRGDTILYEDYFKGSEADSLQASFSVSKSILSILVGRAVEEGAFDDLDDPLTKYVPELAQRDSRFANVTLAHLIDMKSGLAYSDDLVFPFFTNDAPMIYHASDLRRVVTTKSRVAEAPGSFHYTDFNPNLLALALERATGKSPVTLVHEILMEPIGAESPSLWSVDRKGFPFWESGFVATARDQAKIGLMMLKGGIGPNGRSVNNDWHQRSTEVKINADIDVYNGRQWAYKNGWWHILRPGGDHDYAAIGKYGQFIYVSPHNNVVIVRAGSENGAPSDFDISSLFYHVANQLNDSQ